MRYVVGFVLALALGVVPLLGCSENGGAGGSGGSGGSGGGGTGGAQPSEGWIVVREASSGELFCDVAMTDSNTGTIVGHSGTILRTTDGGLTWVEQVAPDITVGDSTYKPNLLGVSFIDASTGTATGEPGAILRTTDGGATWVKQTSGTDYSLEDVVFTDANTGTIVGRTPAFRVPSGAIILRTTDGGATWVEQFSTLGVYLLGVSFTDADTGTAVGYRWIREYQLDSTSRGIILRTIDGGATWVEQANGTHDDLWGERSGLEDVHFTDANTGTAVGHRDRGSGFEALILRTTDGGATWADQTSSECFLTGLSFTDANTGTVVGGCGPPQASFQMSFILRTTDGGVTWVEQASANQASRTAQALNAVSFADANTGVAVGNHGKILRTTDGGGG